MIRTRSSLTIAAAIVAAGVWLGGCATKEDITAQVAPVQSQVNGLKGDVTGLHGDIDGIRGQLKDHDAKLATLDQNTREALQRADAAGKLAQGKFLYSMVLSDDSTRFASSGKKLAPEAQAKLADFAAKLKASNANVYIEIQGYTDSTGSEAVNQRLGSERAEAVRRYLSQQGVALNRMSTISYGAENPVAPNKTRAGRAQNRRVVLIVLQ